MCIVSGIVRKEVLATIQARVEEMNQEHSFHPQTPVVKIELDQKQVKLVINECYARSAVSMLAVQNFAQEAKDLLRN